MNFSSDLILDSGAESIFQHKIICVRAFSLLWFVLRERERGYKWVTETTENKYTFLCSVVSLFISFVCQRNPVLLFCKSDAPICLLCTQFTSSWLLPITSLPLSSL